MWLTLLPVTSAILLQQALIPLTLAQPLLAYAHHSLASRRSARCSHGLCTSDKQRQVDLESCLASPISPSILADKINHRKIMPRILFDSGRQVIDSSILFRTRNTFLHKNSNLTCFYSELPYRSHWRFTASSAQPAAMSQSTQLGLPTWIRS